MIRILLRVTSVIFFLIVGLSTPAEPEDPIKNDDTANRPSGVPDPTPPLGPIVYINPDIPDFNRPQYPGEYYETWAPATLDLADRARLAVHFLTESLNPNSDYTQYSMVEQMADPPKLCHSLSDLHGMGKYFEALPLARFMSGSPQNLDIEYEGLMPLFLKMRGPDGIIYFPTSGRPWAQGGKDMSEMFPEEKEDVDNWCSLSYGTPRTLSAFCIYAQKDPEGPWREAARRLAQALMKTIVVEGDSAYIFNPWILPGQPVVKPVTRPVGARAAEGAWMAQALIQYDRAFGDPEATQLATMLMRYIMLELDYFAEDGRFNDELPPDSKWCHFHTHTQNMIAALDAVEQTRDKQLLNRVLKGYDHAIRAGNGTVGFFPETTHSAGHHFFGDEHPNGYQTSETCEVADMIILAAKLSKLGIDKWDDADRWLRNQFAENQTTGTGWMTDGHLDDSNSTVTESHRERFYQPGKYTTHRAVERSLGGFASHPSANDTVGHPEFPVTIANCCSANATRALYYIWREMLTYDIGEIMWTFDRPILRVHLLLNRASKWADIDSHVPYTGRVDVKVKQSLKLEVRIPEWVKPEEVQCNIEGESRSLDFKGRYAKVGPVDEGQTATLTFPIPERTEKVQIQDHPGRVNEYTLVMRGNTVVHIDPPGKYNPLYQRGHYRNGRTLWRKLTRFVSNEEIIW